MEVPEGYIIPKIEINNEEDYPHDSYSGNHNQFNTTEQARNLNYDEINVDEHSSLDIKGILFERGMDYDFVKENTDNIFETKISCLKCPDKLYSRLSTFRYHLQTIHLKSMYKCRICAKSIKDSNNFKIHDREKHEGKQRLDRTIRYVKTDFNSEPEFSTLIVQGLTFNEGEDFDVAQDINSKLGTPQETQTFTCLKCTNISFAKVHNLKHHLKGVHVKCIYLCKICSKSFADPTEFKIHDQKKHNGSQKVENSISYEKADHNIPLTLIIKGLTFNKGEDFNFGNVTKNTLRVPDGTEVYTCLKCPNESFATVHLLKIHLNKAHIKRSHECMICRTTFTRYTTFKFHDQRQHENLQTLEETIRFEKVDPNKKKEKEKTIEPMSLEIEGLTFKKGEDFDYFNDSRGMRVFTCLKCNNKYYPKLHKVKKHLLKVHMISVNSKFEKTNINAVDDSLIQCDGNTFIKGQDYKSFNSYDNYLVYQCLKCEYTLFNIFYEVKNHLIEVHLGLNIHQCKICLKKFARKKYLTSHIKNTHSEDTTVVKTITKKQARDAAKEFINCNLCGRKYITNESAVNCFYSHSGTINKTFPCDFCSEIFPNSFDREVHTSKVHTDLVVPEPVTCNICPVVCANETKLEEHILESHGNEPKMQEIYKCKVCGNEFKNRLSRNRHMIVFHDIYITKKKTAKELCNICGESFANLVAHERKHKNEENKPAEKPIYECKICHKVYSCTQSFNHHKRVNHGNAKDLVCKICGRSVKYMSNHMRLHRKRFEC